MDKKAKAEEKRVRRNRRKRDTEDPRTPTPYENNAGSSELDNPSPGD